MKLVVKSLQDLSQGVEQVLSVLGEKKIVLFYGEMGVGKTTFIQELLKQVGIDHPEGSPTYSLVNVYDQSNLGKIYHLDLYRLKTLEEAYDIGIEEILDGSGICLIEWPQKIEPLLDDTCLKLHFELGENQERIIAVNSST